VDLESRISGASSGPALRFVHVGPQLSPDDYADALRRDGDALAAAADGNLELPVPSCPGWDVAGLVWHTGEVHHFWGQVASRRLQRHDDAEPTARPPDEALVEWFRDGVKRLGDVLRNADPTAAVWTWAPQKDIAFIQRRMAQETAVHRWDAQSATGETEPIDALLAVDGVDEFMDLWMPQDGEPFIGERASIHLHSTDAHGEWVVTVEGGRASVRRGHEKADVAVRAPASDLLLLLWRRLAADRVQVFGDPAILEAFLARADLD
jgi:uncharacterized protein (TIGR03083 family)